MLSDYATWSYFAKTAFFIALLGSGVFLINLVLSVLGSAFSDSSESDIADLSDSDVSFKFLSFQGLSSFLMIGGWSGLALEREFYLPTLLAAPIACLCGWGVFMVMRKLFCLMHSLKQNGNLDLSNALLAQGTVYMRIMPNKIGRVQVSVQGRLLIIDADSDEENTIASGEAVEVIEVFENRLRVRRLSA